VIRTGIRRDQAYYGLGVGADGAAAAAGAAYFLQQEPVFHANQQTAQEVRAAGARPTM
jgi:hypothetical protein